LDANLSVLTVSIYCSAPGDTLANIRHLPAGGMRKHSSTMQLKLAWHALAPKTRLQEIRELRVAKGYVILMACVTKSCKWQLHRNLAQPVLMKWRQ
jgi:hypothetical protein